MALSSTSFKPGNRAYDLSKMGRPEYWTDEKIEDLLVKLDEWVEKDASICMAGFRGQFSLTPDIMNHIRKKSPVFAHAYTNAQQIVANRMAEKLGNGVHQAHYNKYQSVYDSELKEHEKEMASIKAASQEEEAREKTIGALKMNERILNQVEELRSALNTCDKTNMKE